MDSTPYAEWLHEMERGARNRASESKRGTLLVFSALYSVLHPVHVVVAFDNNVMKGEACIGRLSAQEEQ